MNNYEYCVDNVKRLPKAPQKILDYGCGAGRIVALLRVAGYDAYGCDVFYEGGNYSSIVPELLKDAHIRVMKDDRIPFDDQSFDYILCNQVMEHVPDLDAVLAEITRVLRPGGQLLCLFPDRSVWREGHCGIAFLHWFPKNSRPRQYWAALWRAAGLGYHKKDLSVLAWAKHWCQWLDDWTYYRSLAEIRFKFARHFKQIEDLEIDWLERRYESRRAIFMWWPAWLKRAVVVKLGGLVFRSTL